MFVPSRSCFAGSARRASVAAERGVRSAAEPFRQRAARAELARCSLLRCLLVRCFAAGSALASLAAVGQAEVGPLPVAYPPTVATPQDIHFDGRITLEVDATNTRQKFFRVRETIPVRSPGPMTLLYPAWETASHAQTASVVSLAGLEIRARGRRLAWRRDPVNVFAFHVDVPAETSEIDVSFQHITRPADALLLPDFVVVQWHRVVLYPAGWFARNIPVAAQVTLPTGFHAYTALDVENSTGATIRFKPVSLEALTDSPLRAARHTQHENLAPAGAPPFRLALLAQKPDDLPRSGEGLAALRRMVEQVGLVFGSPHYAHYDALVSLSNGLPVGGIEHRDSSENNLPADYFRNSDKQLNNRDLIAHEYVHSWNGRFRQPADLWTPTLNQPMRDSLLWVYEGQTEYWGRILAARSGLRSPQETLDKLAMDAATVAARSGRVWKSLADSSLDPLFVIGRAVPWRDWQRREDYYPEGVMLWLYVDALIREKSAGKRSLDDFALAFFGVKGESRATKTYTFDDVCAALDAVARYDWEGFLRERLNTQKPDVLDGLGRLGWQLVYTAAPTETFLQDEAESGVTNLTYSIGLTVTQTGDVRAVAWEGPAFDAGLAPGDHIVSVNGQPFTPSLIKVAVSSAATVPIDIEYEADGGSSTVRVLYQGTLRYPRLMRVRGSADGLAAILEPRRRPDRAHGGTAE